MTEIKLDELIDAILPQIMRRLGVVSAGGLFAPTPHDLHGSHHEGTLDHGTELTGLSDDDHTIYLLADGTRTLTGDLAVTATKTIDGVDISAHAAGTAVSQHAGGVGAHDHASAGAGGSIALSVVSDVTATAAEVNVLDGAPMAVTYTIGAEAADTINVALQLKDASGADLAIRGAVRVYLSDDANGDSVVATAPSGAVAIGTDGVLYDHAGAKKFFEMVSEADGDIDFNITEAGVKTLYVVAILPNGKLSASSAVTFA